MNAIAEEMCRLAEPSQLAGKYLTFRLGSEYYGLPVLKVREIINMLKITSVPRMPEYVKGVINLRGKVIPVIDLQSKLGIESRGTHDSQCIVVVQMAGETVSGKLMGLIVDSVEEVANIAGEDIEGAPEFGGHVDVRYILGMAKIKNVVKALLDIDRILTGDDAPLSTENL